MEIQTNENKKTNESHAKCSYWGFKAQYALIKYAYSKYKMLNKKKHFIADYSFTYVLWTFL